MLNNNRITIDGRLGMDPEVMDLKIKGKLAKCTAAISIGKKDEKKDPISINLKAWDHTAEILGSLSNGMCQ
jgi:hypothetical protein